MSLRGVTAILFALGLLACSTTKEAYPAQNPSYSRDHIFLEEIRSSSAADAYDLILQLRPHWLRGRGPKSLDRYIETSLPSIYLDGGHFGDIQSLASVPVESIVVIQLLGASEATIMFGGDNPSGAILITTFSQRP